MRLLTVGDETWEAHADELYVVGPKGAHHPEDRIGEFCQTDKLDSLNIGRARVAACAPEALRLLVELEWCGEVHDCPICGRVKSDESHAEDCKLVAVLRKAGVR